MNFKIYPTNYNMILLKDAVDFLSEMYPDSVDLVITDPAYESLEKHRKIGTTTRLKKKWFPIFPNDHYPELFRQLYRVMRPNTHLYFFCDSDTMFVVKPMAEAAGFKFWKPIVWDKKVIGMGYHFRARCEFILFFEKGHRNLNDHSTPDVLEYSKVTKKDCYPTEKPIELMKKLIKISSDPGDLVIDPFAGSGVVGKAARVLLRDFMGADISPEAVKAWKSIL